ncbi:MAG: hypothetical protein LUD72_14205 [Bacteroidales bacterium]|nr:hypothetical protein [Bacteroidales bacterium]
MTLEEFKQKYGEIAEFVKDSPEDKVYGVGTVRQLRGPHFFTFDKKNIYNLWSDFPEKLTDEEVRIFCKENQYWVKDFKGFQDRLIKRGFNLDEL